MPTFIHDASTSGTPLSGTYNYSAATFQVPSGATAPAAGQGGELFFVPGSGVILVASGTTWVSFALTT